MRMNQVTLLVGMCLLSGCLDALNGREVSMSGAGVIYGSPQNPISDEDLSGLVISAIPSAGRPAAVACKTSVASTVPCVLGTFGNPLPQTTNDQQAYRYSRNQILGYVIAASNNRCDAYKLKLRELSTNISFGLGSLATALGAAGAIFTNGTSQIFSGTSGAASGINAEYNRDILSNVASSVIIPGIDKQRAAILQEIMNRRCYGIESYSLTQALADAIKYHSACTTDVGVAAASSALNQPRGQSLADAQAAVEAVTKMHNVLYPVKGNAGGAAAAAGANPAPGAAAGGDNSAQPGAQASAATAQQAAANPLLGASLNLLECPSLSDTGMLPASNETQGTPGAKGQMPTDKLPGAAAK